MPGLHRTPAHPACSFPRSIARAAAPCAVVAAVLMLFAVGWAQQREPDPALKLTPAESAWLKKHPVWRTVGSSSPPFGWIDESGKFQGMSADYARIIQSKLGIRIVGQPAESWTASLDQLRRRECDISPFTVQTPERSRFLAFTEPLIDLPMAVIVRSDDAPASSLAELDGRRVSVARDWPAHEWLKEHHPEIAVSAEDDVGNALAALALGNVDAFIGDLASATYAMKKIGVARLRVAEEIPGVFPGRIAVRSDWPEAVSILNKTIGSIGAVESEQVRNRWLAMQKEGYTPRQILLAALPVAGGLVILTLLMANRRLDREIERRRETERRLKTSEERWAFAIEGSRDGVWDWNIVTNEMYFSRRCKEMLGYTEEELESRLDEWANRVHPDDFEHVFDEVQRHIRGEVPAYQVEHRVQGKDGNYRWILARGRIVARSAEGKALRMVGTQTDVTESYEAKERLTESEQRYREIFEHTSDAIFVTELGEDERFRYTALNPATAQFFRRPVAEIIGLAVDEALPPATAAMVIARYRHCLETARPTTAEEELEFAVGVRFIAVTLVPVREGSGQPRRLVGIARDITERKRAEDELQRYQEDLEELVNERTAALAASEGRFRALSELIPNVVWTALPDGMIEYVNGRALEYFNRTAEQLIGEGWQSVIHPDDLPTTIQRWMASLQSGDPFQIEYRMLRRDGEYRWHLCHAQSMRGEDGRIVRWFGTTTEIEEHKAVERELQKAKAAAEDAARAKSGFLANMSHEIRTPMNAILGFTQLLRRDESLTPTQRHHLETIHGSGAHLLTLINDVLEMSKIEAGRLTPQPETFDLRELLGDLERMFRVRTDGKLLQLEFACADDVPALIRADPAKIRQILINLIGNSVKFTARGGIAVRTAATRAADLRLIFEVQDTGCGIAAEDHPRLFQLFEQAGRDRGAMAGTGLGLSISREFARMMEGDITFTSELGKGSTFRAEVVVEDGVPTAVAPPVNERRVIGLQPGSRIPRILVVDDNFANRELLCLMLRYTGFEVEQASDGEEAIAFFSSWHPHLILMDLRMPKLDGFEAIRRIRLLPQGGEVRIVAVTASVFDDHREEVIRAGADDFLAKPFQDEQFYEMVRTATGVEYRYADAEGSTPVAAPRVEAAEIHRLVPDDLRAALRAAVLSADVDRVFALLDSPGDVPPEVIQQMRRHAEAFEYQALLELLC